MIQDLFRTVEPNDLEVSKRIRTSLKGHQITMLQAMQLLERGQVDICPEVTRIHTRFGVIGDPVGSGKTLVALAACATFESPTVPSRFVSSTESIVPIAVEHLSIQSIEEDLSNNLIVVPHHLEHQWIDELRLRTTLRWISLNRKTIASLDRIVDLKDYDVVLCKNTILRALWKECVHRKTSVRFSRIFVDEADTVSLPKLSPLDGPIGAKFYWLMTGTPENISMLHSRYPLTQWGLRNLNLVQRLAHEVPWNVLEALRYMDAVVLKNDPHWIRQCIHLDDPIYHRYETMCPRNVHVLRGIIPEQSLLCLQMDDIQGALSHMDMVSDETMLIQNVTQQFRKTLTYEERRLELARESELPEREQTTIRRRIDSLQAKIHCIEERLQTCDECPICYDRISSQTDAYMVVRCCKNKLCIRCLAQICQTNPTCPFCKTDIQKDTIWAVRSESMNVTVPDRNVNRTPTKTEMFRRILEDITSDPERRVLVFSETDGTWTNVVTTLQSMNLPFRVGRGASDEVRRRVQDFRDGKVRVLLLNSTVMGAGLNLQFVTDIIIYHTPSSQTLERQMVGRANRQGRTNPLHVHIMDYFRSSERRARNTVTT